MIAIDGYRSLCIELALANVLGIAEPYTALILFALLTAIKAKILGRSCDQR